MKRKALNKIILISIFLLIIIFAGLIISEPDANFILKNQTPSIHHIFGTDEFGRDLFLRTVKGLSTSLIIGLFASLFSAIFAVIVGIIAGFMPKRIDDMMCFIIDLVMSIPHLILLILISFSLGKGAFGITIGIIFTHFTGLARIIRAEVLQLKEEQYIKISKKLGQNDFFILYKHILPHIIPQLIIGIVIMLPHTILHESAITFLGFGLPPESSAIGIILSESMDFLSTGNYFLFLPGAFLVVVIILFDVLGKNIKHILNTESDWR